MKNRLSILTAIFLIAMLLVGCEKSFSPSAGMVEDQLFLKSGNQHMPVLVSGNLASKKMLVIIHGGPGGTSLAYRDNYLINNIEKELAVAYWDQRFAGNTQGNGGPTDVTDFRKDLKNLLLLLRDKYGSDKDVYLFGHSWGGFLAPYFLAENSNQTMVKGWIQVDGGHIPGSLLAREMLIHYGTRELVKGNHKEEWQEIMDWVKETDVAKFEFKRANFSELVKLNNVSFRAETLIDSLHEPEDVDDDWLLTKQSAALSQWSNMKSSSIRSILFQTPGKLTPDQLANIKVPTLLLWGKYDFVCPPGLADDIVANIGSSDVKKIIYSHSGHSPMLNEQKQFWKDVVDWVKAH